MPTQVGPAWLTLKFWMGKVHQAGFAAVMAQARGGDIVSQSFLHGRVAACCPDRRAGARICRCNILDFVAPLAGHRALSPAMMTALSFALVPFCRQPAYAFGDHYLCCEKYEFHSRWKPSPTTFEQPANEVGGGRSVGSVQLIFFCSAGMRAGLQGSTSSSPILSRPRWAYLLKPPAAS